MNSHLSSGRMLQHFLFRRNIHGYAFLRIIETMYALKGRSGFQTNGTPQVSDFGNNFVSLERSRGIIKIR